MRFQPAWDIEITFDPTYSGRPGDNYVARAYPSGRRDMAFMVETAPTDAAAEEAMRNRIAGLPPKADPLPHGVRTVVVNIRGETR